MSNATKHRLFRWPKDWAPPWVVAWRLLWFIPLQVSRFLFVGFVLIGYGLSDADQAWRDTL
jgi:hypothetical protein